MEKGKYQVVSSDHGIVTRSGNYNTLFGATIGLVEEIFCDCRDFYDGDHERFNKDVEIGALAYKIESWGSGELDGCCIAAHNYFPRIDEDGGVRFVEGGRRHDRKN